MTRDTLAPEDGAPTYPIRLGTMALGLRLDEHRDGSATVRHLASGRPVLEAETWDAGGRALGVLALADTQGRRVDWTMPAEAHEVDTVAHAIARRAALVAGVRLA